MGTEQDSIARLLDMVMCTGTSKNGSPCRHYAVRGTTTCPFHTLHSSSIRTSSTRLEHLISKKIQGGGYKQIPERLQKRYKKYRDDPNILNSNSVIARLEIMWDEYIAQYRDANDSASVKDKTTILEQLGREKEREHKKRYGEKYAVNVNEVAVIIGMVSSIVNRHVSDVGTRRLIQQALIRLPLADVEVLPDANSPD